MGYSPWGYKESDMTERLNSNSNLEHRERGTQFFSFFFQCKLSINIAKPMG